MARKKNLERAIILGLILSTGVYGSAWAAEVTTGDFENAAKVPIEGISVDENNYTVSANTVINGPKKGDATQWDIGGKKINIDKGINVTFNELWLNNANIIGQGNINVYNTKGTPVFISGYIQADNLTLSTIDGSDFNANGISSYDGDITLDVNNLNITAVNNGIITQAVKPQEKQVITINNTESVNINMISAGIGIHITNNADLNMISTKSDSVINVMAGNGVSTTSAQSNATLKADYINIGAWGSWGVVSDKGKLEIEAKKDIFIGDKFIDKEKIGNYAAQAARATNGQLIITAKEGNVKIIGEEGVFTNRTSSKGSATITAGQNNYIYAGTNTLQAAGGNITVSAKNNIIKADSDVKSSKFNFEYGDGLAISPENSSITTVTATAENGVNDIRGAVSAAKGASTVKITGDNNNVYSAAIISGAGDLDTSEGSKFEGKQVTSALYAEKGANINLTGANTVATWADYNDNDTLERTIWAYSDDKKVGSTINLTGAAHIRTNNYELSPKSADVAVAAGTATGLTSDDVDSFGNNADDKRSIVNINYTDSAAGERSYIQGDILAAYAGEVNVNPLSENSRAVNNAGITIEGNLLAGNNGILNVDLGKGGFLSGRADDYGDAGVVKNSGHGETFYDPAFSSDIYKGGDITLTMGDGSQWNVQGQSWITNLNTNGKVTIDLTNIAEEYKNYDSHALTIRNLNGNADIKMDLDGNRSQSDMLYIGQGNGEYNVELENLVTVDDMYADSGEGYKFSGLRFATVGMGSDVKFNVTAKDQGFNNVTYIVDTDVYNSNESVHENDAYNGESISNEKPGNSLVESMLDEAEKSKANEIMLLAADDEPVNDNETQHLNYKLVAMESSGLTDAGKTMLNMSRANYSNAIYMDRLNKRLGEARYINDDPEEDEGMWVRVRHDRIGKDEAFRSQNTMYELGYDKRQECDNGKRRVGFAVDYMHGDTGYNDIAGKGEIDRYGLWLYDTWMGDKGHYADYVAKWGHLDNEFEIYAPTTGEKINGDYSNNVFSVSAEYGRKKDIGNDWYFEPQVQAQLARVTGADYTTSQGTKVNVDGINSLIGRAGFRLGKDFGEEKQSTVYIKADVLHEFLGDQDIKAMDATTNGNWSKISYENEGTWYDVGFGFATQMSKNSYAFMDFEKSFGNDNDETYQINVGMQWSF